MTEKPIGESVFEEFCNFHHIPCEKIRGGAQPTPDYRILLNEVAVFVEIKQIDDDTDFKGEVKSRTLGAHVRAKINEARKQAKTAASEATPAVLLIYNNLDPLQLFGTGPHDFISAMYGELTVVLDKSSNRITDSFHGRNKSFREGKNDSLSAVGGIYKRQDGITVEVFENVYARNPIDYSRLPHFIRARRVQLA